MEGGARVRRPRKRPSRRRTEVMMGYSKIKDFHGARAMGIGSSDIPVLAGFGKKYGDTPLTLYLEKTGQKERRTAGERAEWGHRLEPVVLAKWVENSTDEATAKGFLAAAIRGRHFGPLKVLTEARMPGRPYVLAHADLVDDAPEPRIVEAKTTGFFAGKRREGEAFLGYDPDDRSYQGIPDPVYLQVQWQMLAYGISEAFVAVLIDTGDYREYGPILAAPRVQEKCLALAERLWNCIEARTPPKPETWSDVALMWPLPDDKTAMVGGEDEMKAREYCRRYWQIGETVKRLEEERAELKNALGIYMGGNTELVTPEGHKLASSWVQANPMGVDLKGLREKEPDIYARLDEGGYLRKSERRELRPAKVKGEA
jgi:predicted phage-related endonuclease